MSGKKYDKIAYCVTSNQINTGHVKEYFINNTNDFFLFIYPPLYKNNETIFRHYKNGLIFSEKTIFLYKGNNKIIFNLFIFSYFWYFIYSFKIKNASIIVSNPLFLFFNTLNKIFYSNKIILWIWDYFSSFKKYNFILNFYIKRINNIIFLTDAIKYKYNNLRKTEKFKTISFGLSNESIIRTPIQNNLGFIGSLEDSKGFYTMFQLIKSNPLLRLDIIGDGTIKNTLIKTTKEMGISERIIFFGYQDEENLKKISSKWITGLALYENIIADYSNFADPSKVKLYLELEIPVIMTDVTYFADYIKKESAGAVVNLDLNEIQKEIDKINQNFNIYQKGIINLKESLEFNRKYDIDFFDELDNIPLSNK